MSGASGSRDGRASSPFLTVRGTAPVFERRGRGPGASYVGTGLHPMPGWKHQSFPVRKEPETLRVFCLGGSAAQGWPHRPHSSFPAALARRLERSCPDRSVEVVNACAHAYAAYRVALICDEILEYDPDVLVIWSGNNEFHEEKKFEVSSGCGGDGSARQVIDALKGELTAPNLFWAFGRADPHRIVSAKFRRVREHYRYNLERMARVGRRSGIRVVLCGVPVNLGGWRPNASAHSPAATGPAWHRWSAAYAEGTRALAEDRAEEAVARLGEAVDLDPLYADAWFDLGTALRGSGDRETAALAFRKALMLDAFPFRSVFNDDVERVAAAEGAIFVDLPEVFSRASEDGIPGYDLFVDYVHPTPEGSALAADTVVRALVRDGVIGSAAVDLDVRDSDGAGTSLLDRCRVVIMTLSLCASMRQWSRIDELYGILHRHASELRAELAGRKMHSSIVRFDRLMRAEPVLRAYRRLERAERMGCVEAEFQNDEADVVRYRYAYLMKARWGSGRALGGRHREISDLEFSEFFPRLEYWDSMDFVR